MYRTCLFCSAALGENEVVEEFPVGRTVAFDAWQGRLWAVCPKGELSALEAAWREAEEIAAIADALPHDPPTAREV